MKGHWALVLFVALPWAAPAAVMNDDQIREIAESVASSKSKLSQTEAEKRRVLGVLFHINQKMKRMTDEKKQLTDQLIQAEANVQQLASKIAALDRKIVGQKIALKKRLRAMYKISGEGVLAILFSSSNSSDFDYSVKILKTVAAHDRELISDFQTNRKNYETRREKLKGEIVRMVGIRKNARKQEQELAAEHHSKSKVISELDQKTFDQMSRIRKLREKTGSLPEEVSALDQTLSEMLRPSIFEQKGRLSPPAEGMLARDFGLLVDPHYKVGIAHKGWTIRATEGSPVRAVFEGIISYVGRLEGHGRTVVIDHGDHYHSVYTKLGRVQIREGQQIGRGQVIGSIGNIKDMDPDIDMTSSGLALGRAKSSLYFELRHFSEPENPSNWIESKGKSVTQLE